MWQDIIIASANLLFGYSLVYQVYRGFKERKGFIVLQTSFLTAVGLSAMAVAYISLGMYIR